MTAPTAAVLPATTGRLCGQTVPPGGSGHPELPPALLLPQQQAVSWLGSGGTREGGPAAPACLPAPAHQTAPSWRPR